MTMTTAASRSDGNDDAAAACCRATTHRRGMQVHLLLLSVWAVLVVMAVYAHVQHSDAADVPFDKLHTALQQACANVVDAADDDHDSVAALRTTTTTTTTALHAPPPAHYGVAVWVDDARWLPVVHDTLDTIDARLTAGVLDAHDAAATSALATRRHTTTATERVLHRVVHLREATCARQRNANDTHYASDDKNDDDDNAAAMLCRHDNRDDDDSAATALWPHVRRRAQQQQLGLPTLRFTFEPHLGQRMRLLALSVLTLPPRRRTHDSDDEASDSVQCMMYDVDRYVCVVYDESKGNDDNDDDDNNDDDDAITTATATSTARARALRAALSSVVASALDVASFRRADVRAWRRRRDAQSCRYAAHGLHTLRSALATHNAHAHASASAERDVYALCDTLAAQLARGARVAAAQTVDLLRYHPSFTPQLYIPFDQALLSQLTLLQPLLVICVASMRGVVSRRCRRWLRRGRRDDGNDDEAQRRRRRGGLLLRWLRRHDKVA